ncbi:MAG TPA: hypothetical protein VJT72_11630, partial [Pseudonocardiaceae bacterium]|nr:hypothetical protein [Pseudonocardiaceae bacterium]
MFEGTHASDPLASELEGPPRRALQEVPLHHLLAFTHRGLAAAVDLGVRRARAWCQERGLGICPGPGTATVGELGAAARGLGFRE